MVDQTVVGVFMLFMGVWVGIIFFWGVTLGGGGGVEKKWGTWD